MRKLAYLFAFVAWFAVAAPMVQARTEGLADMAAALTRLTQAVDRAYYKGKVNAAMPDDEILAKATVHDPSLLKHFGRNMILVKREGNNTVLLVCDENMHQALLEDVACSFIPDDVASKRQPRPCEFSLDANAICAGAR